MAARGALASCGIAAALLFAGCGGGGQGESEPSTQTTRVGADARGGGGQQREGGDGKETAPLRGGEASIEDFGDEAAGSQRGEILTNFETYMNAVGDEDSATACSYLAARVRGSVEQLGGKGKGPGCARLLPALFAPTAAAIFRRQAEGRITKVRVEGDRAFVIFHAPGAKLFQMTMVREGGQWKMATVITGVLVPSL
jgi:hypothetical protein